MEQIKAQDGASIVLHSTGSGPGLLVVHGGGVTIDVYRRFAARLADRFTVHLYNRRGRADAPARSLPYTVDQDIADLTAVLEYTGTRNVIGHSGGAFIALTAALRLPIDRLALYVRWSQSAAPSPPRGSTAHARRHAQVTSLGPWRSPAPA